MKIYVVVLAQIILCASQKSPTNIPYKTVQIAGKTWMAENFKGNIAAGNCYDDDLSNCMNMGRLYSYEAAIKSAPVGWHLPTKEEWSSLLTAIRKEGKNPYEVLTAGEFDARLAGFKDADGDYTKMNYQVRYWSATAWGNENDKAWYMYLNKSREMADIDTDEKKCLYSVRYVKD